jgi:cobalt-zinc-cadmium efflux system protein
MTHTHHHSHNHSHTTIPEKLNRAFVVGIGLNMAYVIMQIVIGLQINSLSMLSDAGHNFLDVGGLALSLLAFKLTKIKTSKKYTYGYKKSSILISLLNAVILLVSIGAIGYQSVLRFKYPEPLPGTTIAIIALIGIFINGFSAFLFFRDKEKDINVKSAFLHLLSDALVSLGLVVGGIIIHFTNFYWIDPVLSILVCLVIIISTWNLLKDSIRLSMDGVPENISFEDVKQAALQIEGVIDFHHIHIWAISTTENALTGHLVVADNLSNATINEIKRYFKHELEHLSIGHATIEIETESALCQGRDC